MSGRPLNAARYAAIVTAAAIAASTRPRSVISGAPVASTTGVTTTRPIASEPTSTDISPTRRTATASGTSGMPQQKAARRPSSTVTGAGLPCSQQLYFLVAFANTAVAHDT